jgi:hypothetical protein
MKTKPVKSQSKITGGFLKAGLISIPVLILGLIAFSIYDTSKKETVSKNILNSALSRQSPIKCLFVNNRHPVYVYLDTYNNQETTILGRGFIFDKETCEPFYPN